jgi:hypothetical protein
MENIPNAVFVSSSYRSDTLHAQSSLIGFYYVIVRIYEKLFFVYTGYVACGLLAVGGDAVPDKLVCYATVTDEANGDVGVLDYGGVFLDLGDLANEWTGTAVSASPLALVACSGSPFTQLE